MQANGSIVPFCKCDRSKSSQKMENVTADCSVISKVTDAIYCYETGGGSIISGGRRAMLFFQVGDRTSMQ